MNEIITYTVKEAEDILKVKSRTIREYIRDKKLKARLVGRGYVIYKEDLEQFMKRRL